MNIVYGKLAKLFNDLENHRTDTEHEDALITKTFIFQFCNSYGALFYLAFVKTHGLSPFGAFGLTDHRGEPYHDMCYPTTLATVHTPPTPYVCTDAALHCRCGALGTEPYSSTDPSCGTPSGTCDYVVVEKPCMDELSVQMLTYLVITPLVQVVVQGAIPWMKAKKLQRSRRQRMAKRGVSQKEMNSMKSDDASDQQRLLAQISDEMTLPRFDGVFDEMRPKVVEFGYVTMFSAALPLSLVGTALVNVIELRADAAKVLFQFRRPRYRGADGIGKWRHIIGTSISTQSLRPLSIHAEPGP